MLIDNVYKKVDAYGNVEESYVVFIDNNGVKYKRNITNDREYNYYMEALSNQNKRTEELKKLTPRSEYNPKTYRYMLPEYNTKGLHVYTPLIALITGLVIAIPSGFTISYFINKDNTDLTAITRIPNYIGDRIGTYLTSDDKYISRNEERFTNISRSIFSEEYSNLKEEDAEFVKDYIEACYKINTNRVLEGDFDKAKYKFNFEQFMQATDIIHYHNDAYSEGYKSFIKRYKSNLDPDSLDYYITYDSHLEKYLEKPLSFILQHLDPNDDKFTKMSPFSRIVICEEVKSVLRLAKEDYTFYNHAFPEREQTRDELIEAIDKKEQAALESLKIYINNKKDYKVLKK